MDTQQATQANVDLFQSRQRVSSSERVVRSTRFGRWPPDESLEERTNFRTELDKAIINERADVRRIWNISSRDDVVRLQEVLEKYKGRHNHSIRVYLGIPDHVLPEILVVERCGASLSFPSSSNPHSLDWTIKFRRTDLVNVIRDYFDVLWDRAERILDAGEVTDAGQSALRRFEVDMAHKEDGAL